MVDPATVLARPDGPQTLRTRMGNEYNIQTDTVDIPKLVHLI